MKRLISILLLICFCAALFGCAKRPAEQGEASVPTEALPAVTDKADATEAVEITEVPAPTQKADDTFYVIDLQPHSAIGDRVQLFETDTSIYYLCFGRSYGVPAKLYVSDKEYKDWMPLCAKPNCLHNNYDCNSCLEGYLNSVWLYGRNFYYVTDSLEGTPVDCLQLWKMDLDGSNHEMLTKLDYRSKEDKAKYNNFCGCLFHNKYMIAEYSGNVMQVNDEPKIDYCMYLVDLDDPTQAERLTFAVEGGEDLNVLYIECAVGDILYCRCGASDPNVFRCDLSDRTAVKLCTLPFTPFANSCGLHDGKLYFADPLFSKLLVSIDTETGELVTVKENENLEDMWGCPFGDYIFGAMRKGSDFPISGTAVYDYNGDLIQEIPVSAYDERELSIYYALGDYIFGYEDVNGWETTSTPKWYLRVSDVGTDNFMWRRWEP